MIQEVHGNYLQLMVLEEQEKVTLIMNSWELQDIIDIQKR